MSIHWLEDNTMVIELVVDGSGSAATVTAIIIGPAGAVHGPVTLDPTGTDDEYRAKVQPTGTGDLAGGTTYLLRIVAVFAGDTMEVEESFRPRGRRLSA